MATVITMATTIVVTTTSTTCTKDSTPTTTATTTTFTFEAYWKKDPEAIQERGISREEKTTAADDSRNRKRSGTGNGSGYEEGRW